MSSDPVARSDAFDKILEASPEHISLVSIVKQHQTIIRWLVVALVVAVIGAGVATWAAFSAQGTAEKASDAAKAATSAKAQSVAVCRAANQGRHDSLKLWRYVLTFPPPPDETPAARKARLDATAKFRTYIEKAFAPRDCKDPKPAKTVPFPSTHAVGPTDNPSQQPAAGSQPQSGPAPAPEPGPSRTPAHHSQSASPRPSSHPSTTTPTPHPVRSCLRHPVKCLPISDVTAAGPPGSGGEPGTPPVALSIAALLIVIVGAQWWRCCRVSARFRAPPGRTLRRSAD